MKQYVMIQRPELPVDMDAALTSLDGQTGAQLLEAYNAEGRLGFTGVYAQAIRILALHQLLKARYGIGPLLIEDNAVLTMSGPVRWDGEGWSPESPESEIGAQDSFGESCAGKVKDVRGGWGSALQFAQRFLTWCTAHFAFLKQRSESKSATRSTKQPDDDRADFMRRKYAELMMAHNVWAEELDELDSD